jgi:hypothetical protein
MFSVRVVRGVVVAVVSRVRVVRVGRIIGARVRRVWQRRVVTVPRRAGAVLRVRGRAILAVLATVHRAALRRRWRTRRSRALPCSPRRARPHYTTLLLPRTQNQRYPEPITRITTPRNILELKLS